MNDYFENTIEDKNFYVFSSCNMAPHVFQNLPSNLLYIYGSHHKFETIIDTLNYKFIYITPARYGLYFPVLFFKYINGKFKIKYFLEIPMDSNVSSDKNIDKLEKEFQDQKRKYEEQREKEIEERIKR